MRIASLSLLIVMLSAALSGVSAQSLPEGKPIIPGDVGRVWAYYSPQTPGGERCITFYSLGGDTLIGGQTYRGLVRGGGYSYGGSSVPREATDFYYRQEDDRVYFTRRGMDGEALLFDLGLGDGEVFTDWQGGRWSVEVMDKDESAAFFPAGHMPLQPACLRLISLDDGRVDVIADGVGSLTWGIMPGEAGQLLYSESSVWCTAVALSSPAILDALRGGMQYAPDNILTAWRQVSSRLPLFAPQRSAWPQRLTFHHVWHGRNDWRS